MSRNGSGTYAVPNTFTAGTTITASSHNQNWSDIASEMTNSVAVDGQSTMTGPLKLSNGSAAAPSATFASDPDSGLYRIGANNLGIAVNGAKALDIATTGLTVVGDMVATTVKQGSIKLRPVGEVTTFAGSSAPSGWLLCYGQAVSRMTYADLFDIIGTTYGTGDGSTTFNLPDIRGRVPAGKDDMGGSAAGRLTDATSGFGDGLGEAGGTQTHTLTAAQLPSSIPYTDTGHVHQMDNVQRSTSTTFTGNNDQVYIGSVNSGTSNWQTDSATTGITINPSGGSAHPNVQPTIILNYIIFAGV